MLQSRNNQQVTRIAGIDVGQPGFDKQVEYILYAFLLNYKPNVETKVVARRC
jgi:hypothetical protein